MAGGYVRALFDFHTDERNEISLSAGDVIHVDTVVDGSWYLGTCEGKQGNFPNNFVEPIVLPNFTVGQYVFAASKDFNAEHKEDLGFMKGNSVTPQLNVP